MRDADGITLKAALTVIALGLLTNALWDGIKELAPMLTSGDALSVYITALKAIALVGSSLAVVTAVMLFAERATMRVLNRSTRWLVALLLALTPADRIPPAVLPSR